MTPPITAMSAVSVSIPQRGWRCTARGRIAQCVAALATATLLAGCNEAELYSKLTERQANDLVAALQSAGIRAEKRSRDSTSWSVEVVRGDFARSVDTLRAAGLPRDEFETLGQVFRKEGFVSSALEERARLIYGLSQELSNTLSAIDGVVVARVHLAVPERDPIADKPRPASASVMVKHRSGVDMSRNIGQIKALVVNSVEGLSYDNVTVTLFPAQDAYGASPVAARAAAGDTNWLGWTAAGLAAMLLAAAVVGGLRLRRAGPPARIGSR
jgi:type III secretion protein J